MEMVWNLKSSGIVMEILKFSGIFLFFRKFYFKACFVCDIGDIGGLKALSFLEEVSAVIF